MAQSPGTGQHSPTGAATRRKQVTGRPLRIAAGLIFALVAMGLSFSFNAVPSALASHFRGNTLTWTKGSGNTVTFQLTGTYRIDYPWGFCGASGFSGPNPPVGRTVSPGSEEFDFGDGSAKVPVCITVTSADTAEMTLTGTMTLPHTYVPSANFPGPWTASSAGCCSLSTMQGGNHDTGYRIHTVVDTVHATHSPVSTLPAVIFCPKNPPCDFTIPAFDADGLPLRFRFATIPEDTDPVNPGFAVISTHPMGSTIDPSGHFSWTGYDNLTPGTYSAQAIVEAYDPAHTATVFADTSVSFILDITSTLNKPPAFFSPPTPAPNTVLTVTVGTPVTFTVKATDPDPNDTVTLGIINMPAGATFAPTTGTAGSSTATGTFSWTPSLSPSQVGTFLMNLTAEDQNGLGATTQAITIHVIQAIPTITWPAPASIVYGTKLDGTQQNATASVPGTFVYTPAAGTVLAAGAGQPLSVAFTPTDTANYTSATATNSITVTPAPLTVKADDISIGFGATPPPFTATPSGLVNGDTLTSLGGLTFATSQQVTSEVGTYTITPSGLNAPNYTVAYVTGTLTVTAAPTHVTVTTSLTPAVYGTTVVLSARVSFAANQAAAGSVQFFIDLSPVGSPVPLDINGVGSISISTLSAIKVHLIDAQYAGTPNLLPSTSSLTGGQQITQADTTTIVSTSLSPAPFGSAVTFTATVTSGSLTVDGNVTFDIDGTTVPGEIPLAATGTASYQATGLSVGNHTVRANYLSSDNFHSSTSPSIDQIINQQPTTTTVSSSKNPSVYGDGVSFTATVAASGVGGTPTGSVQFQVGANPPGAPVPLTAGSATSPAISSLAVGVNPVTAVYLPDSVAFAGSAGQALTQTVTLAQLSAVADGKSTVYGAPLPIFTGTLTGVVNGDQISATYATTATSQSPVGSYSITPQLADPGNRLGNYNPTLTNGTLTIAPAGTATTGSPANAQFADTSVTLSAAVVAQNPSTAIVGEGTVTFTVTDAASKQVGQVSGPVSGGAASASLPLAGFNAGSYTVSASYADGAGPANFQSGQPASSTLTIRPAPVTVTITDTNPVYDGSGKSATVATSPPGVVVTVAYSQGVVSVASPTHAGTYDVSVSITDTNYALSGSATGTLTIRQASPTLAWAAPADIVYGTGLSATQLDATATFASAALPGSFTYAPAAGTVLGAGSGHSLTATFTPTDATDFTGGTTSTTINVTKATPAIAWSTPADIVYGTALSSTQLDATASFNGTTMDGSFTYSPAAGAVLSAGSAQTLSVSFVPADSANFSGASGSVTLNVTKAALSVTAADATMVYGATVPALTGTLTGVVNNDPITASYTTTATSQKPIGSYPITPQLADPGNRLSNYTLTTTPGALSITRAPLTVTADNVTKVYGAPLPSLTYQTAGLVNNDTLTGALATTATQSSSVGTYDITQGTLAAANYTISFTKGTLTVTPAILTVTADKQSRPYGAANPALTYQVNGLVNGDANSVVTGALSTAAVATSPAGSYDITEGSLSAPNYTIDFTRGTLSITQAPLTVTAKDATKVYGGANPAFDVSFSGFVNGDGTSVLSGVLSFTTAATAASAVGTYPVTPGGLSASNYAITFQPGALSVTPAALTATAKDSTKVYGTDNPTFSVDYTGFVNGDDATKLTGTLNFSTTATKTSDVGSYAITPSGLSSTNYTIAFKPGTFSITPAPATLTLGNLTQTYDGTPRSVSVTTSPATLTGVTVTYAGSAAPPTNAGSYAVVAHLANTNYTATDAAGAFTITWAPLTVTAADVSKVYGAANPSFTASAKGLATGDLLASLGTLTFSTTATAASGVGAYAVTPSGLTSPNYSYTYVAGTLTVTPAPLDITATDRSKTYGDAVSFAGTEFSTGAGQLVPGDVVSKVTLVSAGASATAAVSGTPYTITPSAAVGTGLGNYAINYRNGHLTVNQAPLTVTANDATKVFGHPNPAFSASYSGFVNNEGSGVLSGTLTFTTSATTASLVGSYSVTPAGLTATNYAITFKPGTLTVTAAATTLKYNGATAFANGVPATLSAVLTDDSGNPMSGQPVRFTLGSGSSAPTCTDTTDAKGKATCSVTPTNQPLGTAGSVTAAFAGDANYLPSSVSAHTIVGAFATAGGGTYAIGDKNAVTSGTVTFSGPQWAKQNSLSGGAAPASFKGFAATPNHSPPACGSTWTAGPGNSDAGPSSAPAYMVVVVASNITKSGSTISGDVTQLAIVKTNADGTGTVVALLPCS